MANEILMTAEGYKALKDELEDLKTIKRGEVSEKIRVAHCGGPHPDPGRTAEKR